MIDPPRTKNLVIGYLIGIAMASALVGGSLFYAFHYEQLRHYAAFRASTAVLTYGIAGCAILYFVVALGRRRTRPAAERALQQMARGQINAFKMGLRADAIAAVIAALFVLVVMAYLAIRSGRWPW